MNKQYSSCVDVYVFMHVQIWLACSLQIVIEGLFLYRKFQLISVKGYLVNRGWQKENCYWLLTILQ